MTGFIAFMDAATGSERFVNADHVVKVEAVDDGGGGGSLLTLSNGMTMKAWDYADIVELRLEEARTKKE